MEGSLFGVDEEGEAGGFVCVCVGCKRETAAKTFVFAC